MAHFFDYSTAEAVYLVYTYRSVTKAARRLGVSQAGLSRRIQNAEERSGIKIFSRSANSMLPTNEGMEYIRLCERLVHEGNALIKKLHSGANDFREELRVITSPTLASCLIPDATFGYYEKRPKTRLSIVASHEKPSIMDADVLIYPKIMDNDNLRQEKLYDMVQGVYVSQSYIDRYGRPKSIDDLHEHRILATDIDFFAHIHYNVNWLLSYGVTDVSNARVPYMTFNNSDARVRAMMAGHGITTTYPLHLKMLGATNVVRLFPEVQQAENSIHFITSKSEEMDGAIVGLLHVMKANIDRLFKDLDGYL